jgi:hypothetical protein
MVRDTKRIFKMHGATIKIKNNDDDDDDDDDVFHGVSHSINQLITSGVTIISAL